MNNVVEADSVHEPGAEPDETECDSDEQEAAQVHEADGDVDVEVARAQTQSADEAVKLLREVEDAEAIERSHARDWTRVGYERHVLSDMVDGDSHSMTAEASSSSHS